MNTQQDNIIRFPGEDIAAVEADAARWLARMTSGSLSLGELAEFELWRGASHDRDRIYRELEAMWDSLDSGSVRRRSYRLAEVRVRRRPRRATWIARLAQMAAAILVMVTSSQYLSAWRYDYYTAPGEIREVALSDGSKVYLSGNTAIDVDVTGKERSIKLARGEAFFQVRHDPRPFTVDVGTGVVRDIGTAFSIKRIDNSAEVAVEEGIVAVSAAGQSDMLFEGQRLSFDLYSMGAKSLVDKSVISAWRRGLYVADGKALGDVLDELDEYYPNKIIMMDDALAKRRVNVVVQLDHIEDWLDALSDTRGVSVRRYGPVTIVDAR